MRVKRGVSSHQRHQKIRSATKGMTHPNRVSVKRGRQTITKALQFAYRDRRNRKRTFRELWNARINAGARLNGTTYSKLIAALKAADISLDRKILSELATNEPAAFAVVAKTALK
ncbi:MAG TPA: 50S ribosomal protein L20 [Candidatus Saccharimonadales bacterium]|nr:50S ribosomal protein L20 [Candidatus Saccharimonadales bacterium]